MPTYEYKCQKCGHKFEKLVFGKEEIKCPKCQSRMVEKLISAPNIGKNSKSDNICPTCHL